MKQSNWIPGILIAIFIGLGVALFLLVFERRPVTTESRRTIEAIQNDLLALELLLTKLDFEVEVIDVLASDTPLPDSQATMVLFGTRDNLSTERHKQILDWVGTGNSLVTFPSLSVGNSYSEYGDVVDPFLDELNMEVWESNSDRAVVQSTFEDGSPLKIAFNTTKRIGSEVVNFYELASDDIGSLATLHAYEQGQVLLLTDESILDNRRIQFKDHALFIYKALKLLDHQKIVLIKDVSYKNFWVLLWQRGQWAFIGLGILIFFASWTRMPRLGPMLPDPPLGRRSLLEHIMAFARFYWDKRQSHLLLNATQDALRDTIRRRRPEWLKFDQDLLIQELALLAQIPKERAESAFDEPQRHPSQFSTQIQTLETMRRSL